MFCWAGDWNKSLTALAKSFASAYLSGKTRTVAMLELVRGQTMELWGFPLDALDLYRRAARIDSSSATARRREADCRARLWGEPAPK